MTANFAPLEANYYIILLHNANVLFVFSLPKSHHVVSLQEISPNSLLSILEDVCRPSNPADSHTVTFSCKGMFVLIKYYVV